MEWISLEEEGFEKLENYEIVKVLNWALTNSYYSSFHYFIDFFKIDITNEHRDLEIEMCFSDFRLNNLSEWSKIISSYPFNSENFCGDEEPARGFLLTLLTQFVIQDVEIVDQGSLLLKFDKGYEVRVDGEVNMADISWTIKIYRKRAKAIAIMCTSNEIIGTYAKELEQFLNWRGT